MKLAIGIVMSLLGLVIIVLGYDSIPRPQTWVIQEQDAVLILVGMLVTLLGISLLKADN